MASTRLDYSDRQLCQPRIQMCSKNTYILREMPWLNSTYLSLHESAELPIKTSVVSPKRIHWGCNMSVNRPCLYSIHRRFYSYSSHLINESMWCDNSWHTMKHVAAGYFSSWTIIYGFLPFSLRFSGPLPSPPDQIRFSIIFGTTPWNSILNAKGQFRILLRNSWTKPLQAQNEVDIVFIRVPARPLPVTATTFTLFPNPQLAFAIKMYINASVLENLLSSSTHFLPSCSCRAVRISDQFYIVPHLLQVQKPSSVPPKLQIPI